MSFDHLYVHEMFDALTPPDLATPPRKGIGARIVRRLGRMGAALRGAVAGRLRGRPSGPIAPDADGSTAAMPARAPRRARRTPIVVPGRQHDLAFTEAAFPDLSPAAREFFNTPLEDCDPAMVGLVLEALAEAIAGTMTPQEGMQDARDVFLALSTRLAALTGGTQATPPETVPAAADPAAPAAPADPDTAPAAPADPDATPVAPADPGATVPQAASSGVPGAAPEQGSAAAPPDGSAGAQGEAAAATGGSDRPNVPPVAQPSSDPALNDAGTNTTPAPPDRSVGPRQFRRRSFRAGRQFAAERFAAGRFAAGRFALPRRTIPFHSQNIVGCVKRPPRLLCYAACAGPPTLPDAPNPARRVTRDARDHRMVVPRYLIPAAWCPLSVTRVAPIAVMARRAIEAIPCLTNRRRLVRLEIASALRASQ